VTLTNNIVFTNETGIPFGILEKGVSTVNKIVLYRSLANPNLGIDLLIRTLWDLIKHKCYFPAWEEDHCLVIQ